MQGSVPRRYSALLGLLDCMRFTCNCTLVNIQDATREHPSTTWSCTSVNHTAVPPLVVAIDEQLAHIVDALPVTPQLPPLSGIQMQGTSLDPLRLTR